MFNIHLKFEQIFKLFLCRCSSQVSKMGHVLLNSLLDWWYFKPSSPTVWPEGFHLSSCSRNRPFLMWRQRHLPPVHSVTLLELWQPFPFSSPCLVFNSVSVRWKWRLGEQPIVACPPTPGTQGAQAEYSAPAPGPFSWPVCWLLPYRRAPPPQVPYFSRTWWGRWPACGVAEWLTLSH